MAIGKGKMILSEWAGNIKDIRLYALGEYYEYLTGKSAWTKDKSGFKIGYKRWFLKNEKEIQEQFRLIRDNFTVSRDNLSIHCFFQRKEPHRGK